MRIIFNPCVETVTTPKVTSILTKYENSWNMMEVANPISSGEGCQTMNINRKNMKEAILLRNKCQARNIF
jgi:hypothetical protein